MMRFCSLRGDLANARFLFDGVRERNLVSWIGMISSYVSNGHHELALRMYVLMCRIGVKPNEFGFPVALKNNYMGEVIQLFYQVIQGDIQPSHLTYVILAKLVVMWLATTPRGGVNRCF
ncbi:uncharacterized protein J3R85_010030 [Psidium guajava]|nr:uncharacterized protein J3R85_010030 [Psidium guajava]